MYLFILVWISSIGCHRIFIIQSLRIYICQKNNEKWGSHSAIQVADFHKSIRITTCHPSEIRYKVRYGLTGKDFIYYGRCSISLTLAHVNERYWDTCIVLYQGPDHLPPYRGSRNWSSAISTLMIVVIEIIDGRTQLPMMNQLIKHNTIKLQVASFFHLSYFFVNFVVFSLGSVSVYIFSLILFIYLSICS